MLDGTHLSRLSDTPAPLFGLLRPGRRTLDADVGTVLIRVDVVIPGRLAKTHEVLDETRQSAKHAGTQSIDAEIHVNARRDEPGAGELIEVFRHRLAGNASLTLNRVGELAR